MTHPLPGSGWLFVTKKNLAEPSEEESEVYPVAYFENGVPWFATPTSSVLRKPTQDELYWGCLVSPGQNSAAMWRETVAGVRRDIRSATEFVTEVLKDPETLAKGGLSHYDINDYAEAQGHSQTAVSAALRLPQFGWSSDTGVPLIRLMEGH